MSTLAELQKLVHGTYNQIWNGWYSTHPGQSQATVTVNTDGTASAYSPSRNLIVISIGKGNLEDQDITAAPDLWDAATWPIWMPNLIHEMLHEYERKVIAAPTPAGRAFHAAHPHPWWGGGHESPFYSAIAARAGYFRITPVELLGAI